MIFSLLLPSLLAGVTALTPPQAAIHGRWDLTVVDGTDKYPMWLEVRPGLPVSGRVQPRGGHALPLGKTVTLEGNRLSFVMPDEPTARAARVSVEAEGDVLTGTLTYPGGRSARVTGRRAPSLVRSRSPEWLAQVDLLKDGLEGWRLRNPAGRNSWSVTNGELVNSPPGVDLVSKRTFTDFSLHVEVNVPPGGNSGIYLRGRHEVQVQDDYGKPPGNRLMGGIYGQIQPMSLPARPAGEWQTFDITLIGRRVTVELNGVTIIASQEIPGITGGALDSDEGEPGPIMLQGDHTGVRYRNILITPAK
jgi:hypothetical protein